MSYFMKPYVYLVLVKTHNIEWLISVVDIRGGAVPYTHANSSSNEMSSLLAASGGKIEVSLGEHPRN